MLADKIFVKNDYVHIDIIDAIAKKFALGEHRFKQTVFLSIDELDTLGYQSDDDISQMVSNISCEQFDVFFNGKRNRLNIIFGYSISHFGVVFSLNCKFTECELG